MFNKFRIRIVFLKLVSLVYHGKFALAPQCFLCELLKFSSPLHSDEQWPPALSFYHTVVKNLTNARDCHFRQWLRSESPRTTTARFTKLACRASRASEIRKVFSKTIGTLITLACITRCTISF